MNTEIMNNLPVKFNAYNDGKRKMEFLDRYVNYLAKLSHAIECGIVDKQYVKSIKIHMDGLTENYLDENCNYNEEERLQDSAISDIKNSFVNMVNSENGPINIFYNLEFSTSFPYKEKMIKLTSKPFLVMSTKNECVIYCIDNKNTVHYSGEKLEHGCKSDLSAEAFVIVNYLIRNLFFNLSESDIYIACLDNDFNLIDKYSFTELEFFFEKKMIGEFINGKI